MCVGCRLGDHRQGQRGRTILIYLRLYFHLEGLLGVRGEFSLKYSSTA